MDSATRSSKRQTIDLVLVEEIVHGEVPVGSASNPRRMASLYRSCRPCAEACFQAISPSKRLLRLGPISLHTSTSRSAQKQPIGRWQSTAATPASATPLQAQDILEHEHIQVLRTRLSESQPCFAARGDEVEVLTVPADFQARLLVRAGAGDCWTRADSKPEQQMIARARRRILISTLYIGVEQGELVCRSRLTRRVVPNSSCPPR